MAVARRVQSTRKSFRSFGRWPGQILFKSFGSLGRWPEQILDDTKRHLNAGAKSDSTHGSPQDWHEDDVKR
jgi:hypothetical protein